MARILILQEIPGELYELHLSLGPHHELVFVHSENEAVALLKKGQFDLIISRVYLEEGDMFQFLRLVKQNQKWKNIPFVCWAGLRSNHARVLNETVSISAHALGATAFYMLDHFSQGGVCDVDAIRRTIERHLPPPAVQSGGKGSKN